MAIAKLKSGETIELPFDEMLDFVAEHSELIEKQKSDFPLPPRRQLTPEQVRVGTKQVITHAERQAFLRKSELGKLLGCDRWDEQHNEKLKAEDLK
ncbi:MAG: hypothetical protein NVS2B14_06050 [Chamaesiphon sp.]